MHGQHPQHHQSFAPSLVLVIAVSLILPATGLSVLPFHVSPSPAVPALFRLTALHIIVTATQHLRFLPSDNFFWTPSIFQHSISSCRRQIKSTALPSLSTIPPASCSHSPHSERILAFFPTTSDFAFCSLPRHPSR